MTTTENAKHAADLCSACSHTRWSHDEDGRCQVCLCGVGALTTWRVAGEPAARTEGEDVEARLEAAWNACHTVLARWSDLHPNYRYELRRFAGALATRPSGAGAEAIVARIDMFDLFRALTTAMRNEGEERARAVLLEALAAAGTETGAR